LYISYNQFCIRLCTQANATFSAAEMCWHELDEMGCYFVMPSDYNFNGTFETCEADVAYPPGWYSTGEIDGTTQFSTFAQYATGYYTEGASTISYTVGDLVTPTTVAFTPSSSNCVTTSSVGNGIALSSLGIAGTVTPLSGSGSPSRAGSSGGSPTGGASGGSSSSASATRDLQIMGVAVGVLVVMISGVAVLL